MIPSRPFHALAPLLAVRYTAWVEQDYHVSTCPNFRHHSLPGWREYTDTSHFGPRDHATGAAEVTDSHTQYFNLEKLGTFIGLKTLWEG